ncbi:MAG: permease [Bacilli bacterium]|nr:permease [Bacilli bacterium]
MDIIKNIAIIFMSIFFEALPFLLLGSLISASIETFISDEKLANLIPKNPILGSIIGVFLGFFIPACDCAVIPVSKRLIKKRVPINVAISFMLASPIINPVVLLSTYYAFYRTNSNIFWLRIILGIIISLAIGIIMGIFFNNKKVITNNTDDNHCHHCECNHDHHHHHKSTKNNILNIFKHTAYDMFDVVKYLMFGAIIASLTQVLLPRSILMIFNNSNILSIIILMLFAYLISLCSTSDSFIGKSLLSSFTEAGIIAYLLLGPMIDIKNTIVLLGNYKKCFVISLISLIFILIFLTSLLVVIII